MANFKLPNPDEKVSQWGLFSDSAREQKAACLEQLLKKRVTDVNEQNQRELLAATQNGSVVNFRFDNSTLDSQLKKLLQSRKPEEFPAPQSTSQRPRS